MKEFRSCCLWLVKLSKNPQDSVPPNSSLGTNPGARLNPYRISSWRLTHLPSVTCLTLRKANSLAQESLSNARAGMKRHFDRSTVPHHFQVGDEVLAFLPIPGSALAAKCSSPYKICECISDTDYVINTPERMPAVP